MKNKAVSEVIGVIFLVAITVVIAVTVYIYVSGAVNTDVYDSYNNLVLKHGYSISNSYSERIVGTSYMYFVSYDIINNNISGNFWYTINGFIYDKANDYLYFLGESEYIIEIINKEA